MLLADPTPLLAEPRPDLDLPLGLGGVAAGLWSAGEITKLPGIRDRRRRWALWIMLPLWAGFGFAALGQWLYESHSFRDGASLAEETVMVVGKQRTQGRRTSYDVTVGNPVQDGVLDVPVAQSTFDRVEPNRECVTLLIERAPNGAARLIRRLRWKARCPWVDGPR